MNKHDLIAAVAASTNLSKVDAANAIDAMLTVITKSLKKKEKVLLVGFGTFQVSRRKAGEGRNPQTGEKIKIPAATVPPTNQNQGGLAPRGPARLLKSLRGLSCSVVEAPPGD